MSNAQFIMPNTHVFVKTKTGNSEKPAKKNAYHLLSDMPQPYPEGRKTVFDPNRQRFANGSRLIPISGNLKGKIVRVLHVRAQEVDCEDYKSYAVGCGDVLRHPEWIPEEYLGPL